MTSDYWGYAALRAKKNRAARVLFFFLAFAILTDIQTVHSIAGRFVPERLDHECLRLLDPQSFPSSRDETSRYPHVGEMFQNLLPLNQPIEVNGTKLQPLRFVWAQIHALRGWVKNLFLGPVYPQSVLNHIDVRTGTDYANSGNYWPSSFGGVDPRMGTKEDYVALAKRAKENGINIIQDVDVHHIGYLPQNQQQLAWVREQLRAQGIDVPANVDLLTQIYLWGKWRSIYDKETFFQQGEISEEAYKTFENPYATPQQIEAALKQIQEGDLFGLKTLNLENGEIVSNVLNDHLWYIRDAGITQFRIDAAKHIKFEAMKTLIKTFTDNVKRYVGPSANPKFFLEYWTVKYRNMRNMLDGIKPYTDRVYFFDYPLAAAIRGAVLYGDSFQQVGRIVADRQANGISMDQLVPIWIDHDFFVPVYNGTEKTVAQLAAGYAMAYMLSSNAPHFYNGFEKENFGHANDPTPAREPINELINPSSRAFVTTKSLVDVFNMPATKEIMSESKDVFINSDSNNHVVIERRLEHSRRRVVARFSRSGDPGAEQGGRLVWEFINPEISVRIYFVEY